MKGRGAIMSTLTKFALGLTHDQQVLLARTAGMPK
jgi:hypothetical protein